MENTENRDLNQNSNFQKPTESPLRLRFLNSSLALGLVAGLIGGAISSMYLVPWYEHRIAGHPVVENHRVVVDEESGIVSAVEKVNASVVSIVITQDLPKYEQISPFGDYLFQVPSGETQRQQVGAGSGFIISDDGTIVTNKHVVSEVQADYTIVTKDGKKFSVKVVARDPFNDVAVVKIDAKRLPSIQLGDSDKLKLGSTVIAIGNALGQFQNTVTTGVVSGIGRNITASSGALSENLSQVIQTDAAINPGNSGGPLINLAGEVVGVTSAVSEQGQLIGFAIPVNQIKKDIDDVKKFGKIKRPFLGVRYVNITPEFADANKLRANHGALVVRGSNSADLAVIPGSPADKAGLKESDLILEVEGQKLAPEKPLTDILRNYSPGDKVNLKVLSDGKEKIILVTLGEAS